MQTVIKTCILHGDSSFVIICVVQPGIPPLLCVAVADWIGANLCLLARLFLFFSAELRCPTWILCCGEENLLPHHHVTPRAQLSMQDAPLPSGMWKAAEHLEITTSRRTVSSCPPLCCGKELAPTLFSSPHSSLSSCFKLWLISIFSFFLEHIP